MKLTSLLKYLRNACLAASLLFGSQAAHAGVPVIDGAHIGKQAAEFIETARRYGEQVKKWQEERHGLLYRRLSLHLYPRFGYPAPVLLIQ